MRIEETQITDVRIIHQFNHSDERGSFIKSFNSSQFLENGIEFEMKESFHSSSEKNVVRGMHFHLPPHDHAKIVFCVRGAILDVVLDLRKDSSTYGQSVQCELSADNYQALYIPKGFAHGFLSLSQRSTAFYFVDGEYSKEHDAGLMYDSFGFDWGIERALLSPRDLSFETFENFKSPF